MNLTIKDNLKQINQFLHKEIDLNDYKYKFLSDYINQTKKGTQEIKNSTLLNIKSDGNGWILIVHGDGITGEMLLIYGEEWDECQFEEINKIFDLNSKIDCGIAGESELIFKLLEFYKSENIVIEKSRSFYVKVKTSLIDFKDSNVRLGHMTDLDELSTMLQQYYSEEYNGVNNKTFNEMQKRVLDFIRNENIYLLIDSKGDIVSFCTINKQDIGIMFTKSEHRGKGYAKIILAYCANILIKQNNIVYLMTDRDKIESNIVCQNIGFSPFFNYVMLVLNGE